MTHLWWVGVDWDKGTICGGLEWTGISDLSVVGWSGLG